METWSSDDGRVLLYLGDCLDVLPSLTGVDAVVTDPPYGNSNHDGDLNARLNDFRGLENKPIANDGPDEMKEVLDAALSAVTPLLSKSGSACCCFCGGGGGLVQCLRGWQIGWIAAACSFFILSFGTSAIPASVCATGGSMK